MAGPLTTNFVGWKNYKDYLGKVPKPGTAVPPSGLGELPQGGSGPTAPIPSPNPIPSTLPSWPGMPGRPPGAMASFAQPPVPKPSLADFANPAKEPEIVRKDFPVPQMEVTPAAPEPKMVMREFAGPVEGPLEPPKVPEYTLIPPKMPETGVSIDYPTVPDYKLKDPPKPVEGPLIPPDKLDPGDKIKMPEDPPKPVTPEDEVYNSAIKSIGDSLNSGKPSDVLQAQITARREAVATAAKGAQKMAAAQIAQTGATGQGTANRVGQEVRAGNIAELSKAEGEAIQAVGAERQSNVNKAIELGQAAKNRALTERGVVVQEKGLGLEEKRIGLDERRVKVSEEAFGLSKEEFANRKSEFAQSFGLDKEKFDEGKRQWDEGRADRKSEFDQTFGLQKSSQYLQTLERLALDNPVLSKKLTDHLLTGKDGALGAFTDAELKEIKAYTEKKDAQDAKLQEVMNKVLEGLPAQIDKANQATGPEKQVAAVDKSVKDKDISKLVEADWKAIVDDPEQMRKLKEAGLVTDAATKDVPIKEYNDGRTDKNIRNYKETYSDLQPGKVISYNGEVYEVLEVGVKKNESGNMNNTYGRAYTKVKNKRTGKEEFILPSGRWDLD